jgi:L-ribulose-5-phosphate 4-epimerase
MLDKLKSEVCKANLSLAAYGLVVQTWGNVSGIDRERGLVVIKPSGVPYESMDPQSLVVVSLQTGETVEGQLKPSSDTPAHLELYRRFKAIGGIAHTHSLYATAWAQARKDIPALGTTHADYFYGPVPCTRLLTAAEIKQDYELNTGRVIVERFRDLDPDKMPAVLVASHGPFTWGCGAERAVENSVVLEYCARLASETLAANVRARSLQPALLDKHFFRKHGPQASYGQK